MQVAVARRVWDLPQLWAALVSGAEVSGAEVVQKWAVVQESVVQCARLVLVVSANTWGRLWLMLSRGPVVVRGQPL